MATTFAVVMNTNTLLKICSPMILAATLVATTGCGKSAPTADSGANSAEVTALEAKALQGDATAAFKLGEINAAKTGNKEAQIEAAKWFHLAGRLGNDNARMGLDTITGSMSLDDQGEAERRVEAIKIPGK